MTPTIQGRHDRDAARDSQHERWTRFAVATFVFLVLFSLALVLSRVNGAFRGEFGASPDEAAHYVTGLMFHDYFAGMHYLSPVKFAENYYVRYPKVAIGHWPPVFYLIQAIWTTLFSVSHTSLMFLMAALAALLGLTLYWMLAPEFGGVIAFSASLVFLALPVAQAQTGVVMADVPLALFTLLAAVFFGRFLDTERSVDAVAFGILAAFAIMTKGSALALALLPPVAILLTRKWRLLRRPSLWASAAIILLLCGPWYFWTTRLLHGAWVQDGPSFSYFLGALRFYGLHSVHITGWGVSILGAIGFIVKLRSISDSAQHGGFWAAMVGLLCGFFVLLSISPTGLQDRLLLPAIPAAIGFAVAGLVFLGQRLQVDRFKPVFLGLGLLGLFVATGFARPQQQPHGFGAAAQFLVSQPQFRNSVMLISSDAVGEGMFISEVAMCERRPGHVVLRASKVLAEEQWNGEHYRSLFTTPQQILDYLHSVPVKVVVIDNSIPKDLLQEHEKLLKETITASSSDWKLLGSYQVWGRGHDNPDSVQVYVYTHDMEGVRGEVHIDMQSTLNKSLTLQLPNVLRNN